MGLPGRYFDLLPMRQNMIAMLLLSGMEYHRYTGFLPGNAILLVILL
jgi:hypothetical protein